MKGAIAISKVRLFAGRADYYVLNDGRHVLAAVEPSSDEAYGTLYRAWSHAQDAHGEVVWVDGALMLCVDSKHVVHALEALCWGQPPGAPHQRGAERLLRTMGASVSQAFTPWTTERIGS